MPPKKTKQFIFKVETAKDFSRIVGEENNKLSIIDVHLGWCGPCEAMNHYYQTLWYEFDLPEKRVEFWSSPEDHLTEEIRADFEHGPLSCRPRFLLFCKGEKVAEIENCDYTALRSAVHKHIPDVDDD